MTEPKGADRKRFIEVRNLHKAFGHIQALRGVDLEIRTAEVLAIVGDNGAGKSTLIKILSGVLKPDKGSLLIDSIAHEYLTPNQAIRMGISTVYQDLALIEGMGIAENLFLGREETWGPFLAKRRMQEISRKLLDRLQVNVPSLHVPVGMLSGGQRQSVAVARAIHQGGRLIILDEPTAALGVRETARVLDLIDLLRKQGYGVVLISHNLHHVFTVADRIAVMRHGRVAGLMNRADIRPDEIVQMITAMPGQEPSSKDDLVMDSI
uniref:Sugar ABC transporter ATP-binding protein n=1 Tax=Desulfatirhabdium butyrativorans TaxID=340467 RepID=A0A7C4W176_9BACT